MFLYGAVSIPQDCSRRFTLNPLGRPVQSNTTSASQETYKNSRSMHAVIVSIVIL